METVLLTPSVTFNSMTEALSFVEKTNQVVESVTENRLVIEPADLKKYLLIGAGIIGVSLLCYAIYDHSNKQSKKSVNN